jgi:2-methylcitrate dehydratase PrpD
MDRRYYGLKALIVALGIGVAVWSSLGTHPHLSTTAHTQYGAAASVQLAFTRTTVKLSHAISHLIHSRDCYFDQGGL